MRVGGPAQRVREAGGAIELGRLLMEFGEQVVDDAVYGHDELRLWGAIVALRGVEDIERIIAGQRGAVVTCLSAAHLHGIPVVGRRPAVVHLAVPRARTSLRGGPATPGIVVHRESGPIAADAARPWLADVATTVSRMLLCCDEQQSVVALDHVLNRKLLTRDQVRAPLRGPGAVRARRAIARSNARARSILETLARLQLEDAGITVEVGVEIQGVGEVDLVVAGLIVVELDGATHGAERQWQTDRERDLRLIEQGFLVIRITSHQLRTGRLVPVVRGALRRYGALPVPERLPFSYRVHAWSQEEAAFKAMESMEEDLQFDGRW